MFELVVEIKDGQGPVKKAGLWVRCSSIRMAWPLAEDAAKQASRELSKQQPINYSADGWTGWFFQFLE